MLDETGVKLQRDGILSTLDNMNRLKALREQQEELLQEMKRALCARYLWPEAYAEEPRPKVTLQGAGGSRTVVKLVMVSEPLQQTREIRFRVLNASRNNEIAPGNWPLVRPKWNIEILDDEFKDTPIEVFGTAVDSYVRAMFE